MKANLSEYKDNQPKVSDHYSEEVTFVGNYLPRKCGIATFTTDLREAIEHHYGGMVKMPVIALNDREEGYDYPDAVESAILQSARQDYERAAEFVNRSNSKLVCLQHEYGIFGGKRGSFIIELLRDLKMPVVTTLHTILKDPNLHDRHIMMQLAEFSDRLVVMSERSVEFLRDIYRRRFQGA